MLRQRPFKQSVVVGLAVVAIAPAGAAASTAIDPTPATGPRAVTVQDLRAPDRLDGPSRPNGSWYAGRSTIEGSLPTASADDGIDTGVLLGLGGLALVAFAGAGSAYRIRARGPRRAAA
jgi:hypothetical protein